MLLLSGAFLSTFVGFVGPIGSLGPKPRGERGRTSWTKGARLVTAGVLRSTAPRRGSATSSRCSPKATSASTIPRSFCCALSPGLLSARTVERGAFDGWVAYSKICTHAGCSVGLFGIDDREPDTLRSSSAPATSRSSIQSTAPARRADRRPDSLPQLGSTIDEDGFLVATGDFDRPVGPLAWDEA